MYNFQVPDPQNNSVFRMIEEPKVGLLIKEASFAYIRQFVLLKQSFAKKVLNQQIQLNKPQQERNHFLMNTRLVLAYAIIRPPADLAVSSPENNELGDD
jgi:hypothetical protein